MVLCAVETWQEKNRLTGPKMSLNSIAFSPNGNQIVAGYWLGGRVVVWNIDQEAPLMELAGIDNRVGDVAFSLDGRLIAGCGDDAQVCVWETCTGKALCTLRGHISDVKSVAFSPCPGIVATGSADQTILIWDIKQVLGIQTKLNTARDDSLDAMWLALSSADPIIGYMAIWQLHQSKDRATKFLRERLKPIVVPSENAMQEMVANLDHPDYKVRQLADLGLRRVIETPAAFNRLTALQSKPRSLEVARRLEAVIKSKSVCEGERLQAVRAIAVLEFLGTEGALEVLNALASGNENATVTKEARYARERLTGKSD